uniref:Origin recognition complex subunit 1 n=1 Tax=Strigops habroptila TaxID=2489341 RepID=A0A672U5D3_STRHB
MGIMNTRQQSKVIYSWYGKPMSSDRKLRTSKYRGILITSESSRTENCIQLGEFILVEGENADEPFVAQLLDLYEDGAQEKHAVVQWFSHITEVPPNKRKLLKREVSPQEVFFDQVPGFDTDIAVETIIKSTMVCTAAPLHVEGRNGTNLKSIIEQCSSNKKGGETESVVQSATKPKPVELQIESKHSASKSSLAKERHSQRVANGIKTPTARKKLQLNSTYMAIFCLFGSFECNMFCVSSFCGVQTMVIFNISIFIHSVVCVYLKLFISVSHSILNALEFNKEEESSSSSHSSCSSSSEEEENDEICTPKKKTKLSRPVSTPKSSRKSSVHTPARTPKKTPLPGTPKTPRNATPEIPRRKHATQKPASVLEEARLRLHVSAVPESLPCREEEFQDIYNFVESKLIDGTGGCMYISGVPGTGKTATVREVIRCLQQAAENDELPAFHFLEVNGMKLTDPHQAYVQILELLTGQKVTATHAAVLLAKLFNTPGPKRKTTVLVVDELDLLWTRKQNVMYNLFDWPTQKHSKLIILAIANTMDLPERIMMNRVASRLGLTRMSFQPYTYKQLQQIISSRLNNVKAFEEDAIQLVSRKVAALSGDARRCLDICRRATEICEFDSQKGAPEIVRMAHVTEAIDEMFSSPYVNAIRNASLHEKNFLRAILAEFRRAGVEEATVQQVYHHQVALCRMEGIPGPTVSEVMAICSRLGAHRLLLVEASAKYLELRVRLNVSQDDVMYALKDE